jgi:hypothetical protein
MKTAKEWAEYLPLDIKLCFIEECERQGINTNVKIKNLSSAILWLNWSDAELGGEFWEFVWELVCDYKGREAEILTDLEWIDDGKIAPKKKKKSKEDKIELAVMFFNENQELEKENAEFKKRHKTLLKANQESMERRVELGDANMKLLSENTELKARCEALEIRNEVLSIEKLTLLEEFTALQVKTKEYQDMVISFLKTDLEAGKEELTYWQQLKQLFGCN